jgi:hypothetical protein
MLNFDKENAAAAVLEIRLDDSKGFMRIDDAMQGGCEASLNLLDSCIGSSNEPLDNGGQETPPEASDGSQPTRPRSVSWPDANGLNLEDIVSFYKDDAPCRCRSRRERKDTDGRRSRSRSPYLDLPLTHHELMVQLSQKGVQLVSEVHFVFFLCISYCIAALAYGAGCGASRFHALARSAHAGSSV